MPHTVYCFTLRWKGKCTSVLLTSARFKSRTIWIYCSLQIVGGAGGVGGGEQTHRPEVLQQGIRPG